MIYEFTKEEKKFVLNYCNLVPDYEYYKEFEEVFPYDTLNNGENLDKLDNWLIDSTKYAIIDSYVYRVKDIEEALERYEEEREIKVDSDDDNDRAYDLSQDSDY